MRNHNVVASLGGPLIPFMERFKGKLFFFAYYEIQPQPSTATLTQAVLIQAAQQGNFTYVGADSVKRTVNLLQVAGGAGFTSTVDPTIASILGKINASQVGRETIASGNPLLLNGGRNTVSNLTQSGVVFGGGFTPDQLQKALSTVAGGFSNTALISNVANIATLNPAARTSQVNPALYGPASTPGQFASFVYLRHNTLYLLDMSINKEVRIRERLRMTWRLVALNFLNHPFFDIGDPNPTSTTFGQITDTTAINNGTRRVQFRVSIDW